MTISKGTVGALAVTCVALGAAGAFVATRQGAVTQFTHGGTAVDDATTPAALGTAADTEVVAPPASTTAFSTTGSFAPAPTRSPRLPADARGRQVQAPGSAADDGRAPSVGPARPSETALPQPSAGTDRDETRLSSPPVEMPRTPEAASTTPLEVPREEFTVPAQAVIGLQLDTSVSSEKAEVEDEVVARVTRDVRVGEHVAIPAGSKVQGFVTLVERGGRLRERARLGVRFTTVVLGDGTRLPIDTETVYRDGESATRESAAKIGGGAIGGAILGGLFGGAKGAAIGSSVGAGAGTAAVMTGGRNAAVLNSNTPITVRLEQPVTVATEPERR
jgi:hypothetical protein